MELAGFYSRRRTHGIVWKELMRNMDSGGRIICFVKDSTTCTMIRSYLRVGFSRNSLKLTR